MTEKPWWQAAFEAEYLQIYAHRDDSSAMAEAKGVSQLFQTTAGPILDACCGNGRHAQALQQLGYNVFAFDYSSDLIKEAQKRSELAGRIFQSDVRSPGVAGPFAAITLFFTAFGYFDEDCNRAVVQELATKLLPAGLLMLDLPNPELLRQNLVPHSERETETGLQIIEDRRLVGDHVIKEVQIFAAGALRRRYSEEVRLYSVAEIEAMGHSADLALLDCWPSLLGPEQDQGRQVCWLQKPAA